VKKNTVVSTRYSTVNMIRTIEDVLGLQHVNLNTAYQPSMDAVFNTAQSPSWTYSALVSSVLKSTTLNFASMFRDGQVQYAEGTVTPAHPPSWWAEQTRGFDFSSEDRIPTDLFNEVLWEGLMDGKPYPSVRGGQVMRTVTPVSLESAPVSAGDHQ
jgi:hypothetical protein